jgi:TolB-like protein/Tfp pilus assembly protein PilF
VATIHEVGETPDGQPFIVMEFCEGETLSQRIRRKPLDSGEFLAVARQIAGGVTAAHDTGVIHRDLKSPNIIIETNGAVKILDFGLAKLQARDIAGAESPSYASTNGQFFGTLHFLSPEQARGGTADERSDLFALGVVFYQMATGSLPFNGDAPLLVLEKIRDEEPEPFRPVDPGFPPGASKIISKLLQKDPAHRYQSARELLTDLEHIDAPTLRMTATHSRSLFGPTKRHAHPGRLALAALGLIIVLASVFLVRQGSAPAATPAAVSPATPIRSMAVLPLNNLAKNTRDEFLSVGLADALVTKLQQIPSLQVRPTSAVLEFHDNKVDSKEASEKLNVDGILEGHFLAAGDLVRVNLQLTDSRTGYSVWAASIDGQRNDLLKLIDDVSARTVEGLNAQLGIRQVRSQLSVARSSKPEAYEEYLKARARTGSFRVEDFNQQVGSLKRAIQIDPKFAAAYADLAIALSLGHARSLTTESIQQAEWYARQAVRLDPNLPQAHLALGRVFVRYPDRYPESVREILAALRLNGTDTHALNSVATYFVSTGDMQNADCIGDRIMRLDPASNEVKMRGYWHLNGVDPEGAIRLSEYALQSKDTELAGHDIRANAYILQGNYTAAVQEAEAIAKIAPDHYLSRSVKALIAAARGDAAATEAHIRSFQADANRNHWAAFRVALCYAKLGNHEKAMAAIRQCVELGHHSWYAMVKHPWLQSLQGDAEFQQMLQKIKGDLDDVRDDVIGVYQLLCGA